MKSVYDPVVSSPHIDMGAMPRKVHEIMIAKGWLIRACSHDDLGVWYEVGGPGYMWDASASPPVPMLLDELEPA